MNKLLLFLAILLFVTSCIDDIELSVPENQQKKLSIVGSIKKQDSAVVSVQISRSTNFDERAIPDPVSGALVYVLNEDDNALFVPAARPGAYELTVTETAAFQIKTGESYRLYIEFPSGETYESSMEPMHAVPKPDSMSVRLVQRSAKNESGNIITQDVVELLVHTPLTTEMETSKSRLKWDFEGTYQFLEIARDYPLPAPKFCYITQQMSLSRIAVFNGLETAKERLDGFAIVEEPVDYRFALGFYVSAQQQSLSEGAYQYWNNVSQVVSRTGSLFEPPAGVIKSNIRNINKPDEEVLGYFYCSEVATVRRKVRPDEVNRPTQRCYQFSSYADAAPYCQDCLRLLNSSAEKPGYWED